MHFPPKFLQKRFPPTFSTVHLLHRLYGIDAPVYRRWTDKLTIMVLAVTKNQSRVLHFSSSAQRQFSATRHPDVSVYSNLESDLLLACVCLKHGQNFRS